MKKHRRGLRRAIFVGLLLVLSLRSISGTAETLEVAIFEYPPLLSEHKQNYGLEPSVVSAAFEQVNVKVNYHFFPPARAIEATKLGNFDATLGWVHSEEREKSFYFSDAIAESPLVFFHLKSFPFNWKTYADVYGIPIGTVSLYHYGTDFHEAVDAGKIPIEEVSQDELNFKKLLAGRIKLTPVSLYVGYDLIQKTFDARTADLFTHHPRHLKISVHHVLFPRAKAESASRVKLFNKGLQKLKENGGYQRILDELTFNK